MIFDTHAHYDSSAFDEDRDEVLAGLAGQGIGRVCNIACDRETLETTAGLVRRFDWMVGAAGFHPEYCEGIPFEAMDRVEEIARTERFVAVGEIGLDYYHRDIADHDLQKEWFARQLELARSLDMPVVIHSRDAAKDTLDLMKDLRAEEIGGVVHCFSYPWEVAREVLKMGFYLGIGGVVTYQNARKLAEVVEKAPMDRLVLETDAPYLTPVPHRGERNSSAYLPLVAARIAEIRGITAEEVVGITEQNALRLYRMEG